MQRLAQQQNPVTGPNIAVIGTGGLGRIFLRILHRLGSLEAIIVVDEEDKEEFQTIYETNSYESLEKACNATSIDGVIINTPQNTLDLLQTCIELKINNILLIPYNTLDQDHLEKVIALKNQHQLHVEVGLVENFNPVVNRMWQLIDQDAVGKVRSIIFERRSATPPNSLDYIGDVFHDIGLHDFNLAQHMLDTSFTVTAHSTSVSKIANTASICLQDASKLITIRLSRDYAGKKRSIEVEGTKATMFVDLIAQTIELNFLGIARGEKKSIQVGMDEGTVVKTYGEPIEQEIWNFLDAIANPNQEPMVSIEQLLTTYRLATAAKQSAQQHAKINFSSSI